MPNTQPYGGVFDLNKKQERLREIETFLCQDGIWDNPDKLTPVLQEKSQLGEQVENWLALRQQQQDSQEWLELAEEDGSQEILQTLFEALQELQKQINRTERQIMLASPEDRAEAILEIHPGAGGTEAQDWAQMLFRMYKRWAEANNLPMEILDFLSGDEAGIKSVTFQLKGPNTYGLLKSEKGIHRLVRISPFDSSGRRHTSFASVDVYPYFDQDIDIEIKDEDLRIDVFRSSGPGGQSVNKTSSAIRITHLPTNIVVQCQDEKSQHKNKSSAMKILKARLYELELRKREQEKQAEYESKDAIAWGSQIRSYVLQPHRLVKDHRTNAESFNVDEVLDGNIDMFISAYLFHLYAEKNHA